MRHAQNVLKWSWQVRTNAWQIVQHGDAHVLQMLGGADAGQQQELAGNRTAPPDDDNLAVGAGGSEPRGVRNSTPTARSFSSSTRVAWAWVWMVRLGRLRAGRRYAAAVLQRRRLLVVVW